jgi:hypothetical protein
VGTEPFAVPATDNTSRDWRSARRGTPWLGHAIAGGGGALVAAGVVAIGADLYPDPSDDPGWAGALLCVALVVVSIVALPRVPALIRSALIATIAVGIAGAAGFLLLPGVHGVDDLRGFFALTVAAWVVAFLVGPTRGRTLLLGLALLLAFTWALAEVADFSSFSPFPITTSIESSSGTTIDSITPGSIDDSLNGDSFSEQPFTDDSSSSFDAPDEPNWGELGIVAAIFGVAYLLAVALLDARGRSGTSTAFVAPGVVALIFAIYFFATEANNAAVAGAVSVAAGLFCGAVGTQSHRRFTVWTGAFLATIGAALLAGQLTSSTVDSGDDNGATVFGITAIVFGAVMVAVAFVTARFLREPVDGDDEPRNMRHSPASYAPE